MTNQTHKTPKPWTKEHELAYWTAKSDDYYLTNIRKKFGLFEVAKFLVDKVLSDLTAADIGGGAYGGVFSQGVPFKQAILVDALAPEFRAMDNLPSHIDSITADFDDIPLRDEIADVVFAWNVFDHARNDEHFIIGMLEVKRLLKPGGLFFGSFPLRKQPSPGHPVTLTERLVMRQLTRQDHEPHNSQHCDEFNILKTFKVHKPTYSDETLFVVAEKLATDTLK